ncbi:MAG: ribosome small subunit-dependent GTPase A [Bacteroidales bacterium]|nr:ribosome small subunit-dependent GTPase A [Bacteroidales bacterium]
MKNLTQYGWNTKLQQQKQQSSFADMLHGRVAVTHKTCYDVITDDGLLSCELTGNMLYGRETSEYPCTGDWVILQKIDDAKGIILDMLPRQKALYRLKAGTVSEKQAIASHIDKAFVVQSLDDNFNVRRLERFMLQLADEGIEPLIILTKTDLGYDKDVVERELKHIAYKVPVLFTSIFSAQSVDKVRDCISPGETAVFTGSSGVGKSTLINKLFGSEVFETYEISDSTGKGRHTTTRREMILLPNYGVLIDTPGVKVFGVTNNDKDNLAQVMNIDDFEEKCRFSDCKHVNEIGCAVIAAVRSGQIGQEVYESYLKLRREAEHYSASEYEKRKQGKALASVIKDMKKNMKYLE